MYTLYSLSLSTMSYIGNWKHGCGAPVQSISGTQQSTHIIATSKSPYAWLVSLYRRPYNDSPTYSTQVRKMSFYQFIRSKICTRKGQDHRNSDNYKYCSDLRQNNGNISNNNNNNSNSNSNSNNDDHFQYISEIENEKCNIKDEEVYWSPIEMYNLKLRSYIHVNNNIEFQHFIKYEDLLIDPLGTLHWLLLRIPHLKFKYKCFQPLKSNSKGGTDENRKYFIDRYFINKTWELMYSNIDDILYVNSMLDKEVMKAWKYDFLSTNVAIINNISSTTTTVANNNVNVNNNNEIEGMKPIKEDTSCWECWNAQASIDTAKANELKRERLKQIKLKRQQERDKQKEQLT